MTFCPASRASEQFQEYKTLRGTAMLYLGGLGKIETRRVEY